MRKWIQGAAVGQAAAVIVGLTLASSCWAGPLVTFGASDLGGGLFRYQLILKNLGGGQPLSGLDILNGNSLFGLDASSKIAAPPNWSFLAPLPPFADDLDYFSSIPSADVAIGATLGGFYFDSTLDPAVVMGPGFAVEAIGGISASQISLPNAQFVAEPSSLALLAASLNGLALVLALRLQLGGQRALG
jgi:hypothetical protein